MKKRFQKQIIFSFLISFLFFLRISPALAITASSGEQYEGIDVSNWQGHINYSEVKSSGIDIVYIKSSQGSNTKDTYFDINYENAKANELKVGFYHYVTARNTQEAEQEATFFASIIAGKVPDCKLAMDFESFGDLNQEEINNIANIFLETVERLTQKEAILYSDLSNSQNRFDFQLSEKYSLWLAYYSHNLNEVETKWENYVGLQYTDQGIIPGINGLVDRDIFTKEVFLEEVEVLPDVPKTTDSINTEMVYVTVKKGDTLGAIAKKYRTTVQELADINQIENPNLIYPGQILKIITNSTIPGSITGKTGAMIYIVKSGDTLSQIAENYGVTVEQIIEANIIENPNLIYPGEKIRITQSSIKNSSEFNSSYYTIQRGDTLWKIARKYGVSVKYLVNLNGIQNPNLIYPGTVLKIS